MHELNFVTRRVEKVKARRAVSMQAWCGEDLDLKFLGRSAQSRVPSLDIRGRRHQEAQVIEAAGTPDDIRRTARYWRGKIRYEKKDWATAYNDLQAVAVFGGARGAECKYLMASIAFQRNLYEATETEIFELVDQFASFDDWKFKAFVLLVRTYIGLDDLFQARTTAESILDYVTSPDIRAEVNGLLEEIHLLENTEQEFDPLIPENTTTPNDSTSIDNSTLNR